MFLCLQCSKSCGRGYQYRPVECSTTLNRAVSLNAECDRRTKPPVWRQCNQGECGSFLFWRVGPWSEVKEWYGIIWSPIFVTAGLCLNKPQLSLFFSSQCSVSCGSGVIRRAVKCMARNRTYLDDSYCTSPTSPKPDPARQCQMKACKWQTRFSYLRRPAMHTNTKSKFSWLSWWESINNLFNFERSTNKLQRGSAIQRNTNRWRTNSGCSRKRT